MRYRNLTAACAAALLLAGCTEDGHKAAGQDAAAQSSKHDTDEKASPEVERARALLREGNTNDSEIPALPAPTPAAQTDATQALSETLPPPPAEASKARREAEQRLLEDMQARDDAQRKAAGDGPRRLEITEEDDR